MNENETNASSIIEAHVLFSKLMPNMSYFESRFEIMQNNYEEVRRNQDGFREEVRRNQDGFREQLRDFKIDVDRRFTETHNDMKERFAQVDKHFEQVDKRLEQIIISIDKIGDKMDYKDERQRKFTLRMFSIAISFTGVSILGVLIKVLHII